MYRIEMERLAMCMSATERQVVVKLLEGAVERRLLLREVTLKALWQKLDEWQRERIKRLEGKRGKREVAGGDVDELLAGLDSGEFTALRVLVDKALNCRLPLGEVVLWALWEMNVKFFKDKIQRNIRCHKEGSQ